MKVDETNIVYGTVNPQVPMLLYRSGSRYFLYNYCATEQPLMEIDREEAWDLLNISDAIKKMMRES